MQLFPIKKIQESSTAATKSDANESITNEILSRNSEEELAFKKCGIPNRMGLNKGGLEFLSSGQTKAGKIYYFWFKLNEI